MLAISCLRISSVPIFILGPDRSSFPDSPLVGTYAHKVCETLPVL